MPTEIKIICNGNEVAIHTSCSQPVAINQSFGPYTIIDGTSANAGPLPYDGQFRKCEGEIPDCETPVPTSPTTSQPSSPTTPR